MFQNIITANYEDGKVQKFLSDGLLGADTTRPQGNENARENLDDTLAFRCRGHARKNAPIRPPFEKLLVA